MNTVEARKLVTAELVDRTSAGKRVYSPRTWPLSLSSYPAILVSAPAEHKTSLGRHSPQFTTITTILIDGRVLCYDDGTETSNGAGEAWEAAEILRVETERALIGNPAIRRKFQQIADIRSQTTVNSDGEAHTGQFLMEMDFEYYQAMEDFFPAETHQLCEVNVKGVHPAFELSFNLCPDESAPGESGSETERK